VNEFIDGNEAENWRAWQAIAGAGCDAINSISADTNILSFLEESISLISFQYSTRAQQAGLLLKERNNERL